MTTGEGIEAEISARKGTFYVGCAIPLFNVFGFWFLNVFSRRFLYIFSNAAMSIMLGVCAFLSWKDL